MPRFVHHGLERRLFGFFRQIDVVEARDGRTRQGVLVPTDERWPGVRAVVVQSVAERRGPRMDCGNSVVAVGDVLRVKVLEIDIPRNRISVTRKY